MAYTEPTALSVGQILTASYMNTYLRNNMRYFKGTDGPVAIDNYVIANVGSLGTSSGDTAIIGREQMSVSNQFRPTRWLRRFAAGTDWNNVALHDGIDIDGAFPTPGASTRTWYERRPNNQQHLWGDQNATWMALNNGSLGIGTTSPQGRVHAVGPNGGGCMFWDYNGFGGSSVQILAAGTVANACTGIYALKPSTNAAAAGTITGDLVVLYPGRTSNIYSSGGETVQMTCSGAGAVSINRSAGAQTYKIGIWLTWI